jgi:hypothetical protein
LNVFSGMNLWGSDPGFGAFPAAFPANVSRGVLLPRGLHPLAVDLNKLPFLRVPRADVALGVVVGAAAAVERVRIVERAMRSGRLVVVAPPALGPRALLVDHGHEEPHRSSSRRRPNDCERALMTEMAPNQLFLISCQLTISRRAIRVAPSAPAGWP